MDELKSILAEMYAKSINNSCANSRPIPASDLARAVRAARLAGVKLRVSSHSNPYDPYERNPYIRSPYTDVRTEYLIVNVPVDSECALVVARFEFATLHKIWKEFGDQASKLDIPAWGSYFEF